jgi:hypothetical protein
VRRVLTAIGFLAGWLLLAPTAALADPPGPTDYQSEVTAIEPPAAGIEVEIVGGDSFVLLRVASGLTVEVVGYQGEPYLRFLPDGTVEENRLSPAKYLNEDRYGGDAPAEADAAAAPEWQVVARDGSYAWHDHRTHWMNPMPPPGLGPGDQVAEGVIPLLVDGEEVDVTVMSTWQEAPSPMSVTLGIIAGLAVAAGLVRRRLLTVAAVVSGLATLATVAGVIAFLSVPAETTPSWGLWVFPVTALLLAIAATGRFGPSLQRYQTLLVLIAALQLVAWGISHWGWLWAAILPTALPFWLDRFVASTVLVGSLGAAAATIYAAAGPDREASFR